MRLFQICTSILFFSFFTFADKVLMNNGDTLTGEILQKSDDIVILKTEYCAEIKLELNKIKSIETADSELKKVVEEQMINEKVMDSPDSPAKDELVKTLIEEQDNAIPSEKITENKWKMTLAVGLTKEKGNTDEENHDIKFDAKLTRKKDEFKLSIEYENEKTNGTRTDNELDIDFDYQYNINERHNWYAKIEGEREKFDGIDARVTNSLGYGYYLIKNEKTKLLLRSGGLYRHIKYDDDKKEDNETGLDLGFRYEYKPNETWNWYTYVRYTPSTENLSLYIIEHESALILPLSNVNWSLKLGVKHDYMSVVPDSKQKKDTTYFTNLLYHF